MEIITKEKFLGCSESERFKIMVDIINGKVRLEENVTTSTRKESHEQVKPGKQIRYNQIMDILGDREMTAKEVAVDLYSRGLTDSEERNYSQPRLTELVGMGKVVVVGKKVCQYTNKKVAIYKINK